MIREDIDGDRAFVVHQFLSAQECTAYIARSEGLGFETFTIDGEVYPGFRNNARVVFDDPELAAFLWPRAATHLSQSECDENAVGLNPRFRFYRYTGDEAFAPHCDGSITIGELVSKQTLIMYLNDAPSGGETRFYGPDAQIQFVVRPQRGKALFFDHELLHEGAAVQAGAKYVLRTDVMYGQAVAMHAPPRS